MNETTVNNEVMDELKQTNVGFRFLHKNDQMQSSAMLFLQWCLAPQAVQYLKEKEVTNARVFVTVRSPREMDTRYVFSLASPQELIEFHRPGYHTISGVIVWGDEKRAERAEIGYLTKNSRYSYEYNLEKILYGNECKSFGQAELVVDVAEGFFAPEMSPRMSWYINLWFGEPAWDECEVRRRRLIAFFVQTPLLAVWIPFICTVRLAYALLLSVVFVRKNIPWEAVVRPFDWNTAHLETHSNKRWGDDSPLQFFVPINHMIIFTIAFVLSGVINLVTDWSIIDCAISLYSAILIVILVSIFLPDSLPKKLEEMMGQRKLKLEQTAQQEKALRFDGIYSDMLCTTAPADGTLRTRRQGFRNNVVLAYHNLKVRICRPTARG